MFSNRKFKELRAKAPPKPAIEPVGELPCTKDPSLEYGEIHSLRPAKKESVLRNKNMTRGLSEEEFLKLRDEKNEIVAHLSKPVPNFEDSFSSSPECTNCEKCAVCLAGSACVCMAVVGSRKVLDFVKDGYEQESFLIGFAAEDVVLIMSQLAAFWYHDGTFRSKAIGRLVNLYAIANCITKTMGANILSMVGLDNVLNIAASYGSDFDRIPEMARQSDEAKPDKLQLSLINVLGSLDNMEKICLNDGWSSITQILAGVTLITTFGTKVTKEGVSVVSDEFLKHLNGRDNTITNMIEGLRIFIMMSFDTFWPDLGAKYVTGLRLVDQNILLIENSIDTLRDPAVKLTMNKLEEDIRRCRKTTAEMERIINRSADPRNRHLLTCRRKYVMTLQAKLTTMAASRGIRPEPFAFRMTGPPGTGKTVIGSLIMRMFHVWDGIEEEENVYIYDPSKFDGNATSSSTGILIDDGDQANGAVDSGNSLMFCVKAINTDTRFYMKPDLPDKNAHLMLARYVVDIENKEVPDISGYINSMGAFARRWNTNVRARPKAQYVDSSGQYFPWVTHPTDGITDKMEFQFTTWKVDKGDKTAIQEPEGGIDTWINATEFVVKLKARFLSQRSKSGRLYETTMRTLNSLCAKCQFPMAQCVCGFSPFALVGECEDPVPKVFSEIKAFDDVGHSESLSIFPKVVEHGSVAQTLAQLGSGSLAPYLNGILNVSNMVKAERILEFGPGRQTHWDQTCWDEAVKKKVCVIQEIKELHPNVRLLFRFCRSETIIPLRVTKGLYISDLRFSRIKTSKAIALQQILERVYNHPPAKFDEQLITRGWTVCRTTTAVRAIGTILPRGSKYFKKERVSTDFEAYRDSRYFKEHFEVPRLDALGRTWQEPAVAESASGENVDLPLLSRLWQPEFLQLSVAGEPSEREFDNSWFNDKLFRLALKLRDDFYASDMSDDILNQPLSRLAHVLTVDLLDSFPIEHGYFPRITDWNRIIIRGGFSEVTSYEIMVYGVYSFLVRDFQPGRDTVVPPFNYSYEPDLGNLLSYEFRAVAESAILSAAISPKQFFDDQIACLVKIKPAVIENKCHSVAAVLGTAATFLLGPISGCIGFSAGFVAPYIAHRLKELGKRKTDDLTKLDLPNMITGLGAVGTFMYASYHVLGAYRAFRPESLTWAVQKDKPHWGAKPRLEVTVSNRVKTTTGLKPLVSKVSNASFSFVKEAGESVKQFTALTAISNCYCLVNLHAFSDGWLKGYAVAITKGGGRISVPVSLSLECCVPINDDIVLAPMAISGAKANLFDFFPVEPPKGNTVGNFVVRRNGGVYVSPALRYEFGALNTVIYTGSGGRASGCVGGTQAGDCGGLHLAEVGNNPFIAGVHVGSHNGDALYSSVTQAELSGGLKTLQSRFPWLPEFHGTASNLKTRLGKDISLNVHPKNFSNWLNVHGSTVVIGATQDGITERNPMVPSPLAEITNELSPSTAELWKPAVFTKEAFRTLAVSLDSPVTSPDFPTVTEALIDWKDLVNRIPEENRPGCSALSSIEEIEARMDWSTSAGFPYNKSKLSICPDRKFTPAILEQIADMEEDLRQNEKSETVSTTRSKAELRKTGKLQRLVQPSPLADLVLHVKYFGKLLDWVRDNGLMVESALGADLQGAHGKQLADYLFDNGECADRFIATDCKKWDQTVKYWLKLAAAEATIQLMRTLFKMTDEELAPAKMLLVLDSDSHIEIRGTLVSCLNGVTSGTFLTAWINGVGGAILRRYAYHRENLPGFCHDAVKAVGLGDDCIGSVNPCSTFNCVMLAKHALEFGVTITGPTKTEVEEYYSYKTADFLNRRMVYCPLVGGVVWAISPESLLKSFLSMVPSTSVSQREQCYSTIESALMMSYVHGEWFFDLIKSRCLEQAVKLELPITKTITRTFKEWGQLYWVGSGRCMYPEGMVEEDPWGYRLTTLQTMEASMFGIRFESNLGEGDPVPEAPVDIVQTPMISMTSPVELNTMMGRDLLISSHVVSLGQLINVTMNPLTLLLSDPLIKGRTRGFGAIRTDLTISFRLTGPAAIYGAFLASFTPMGALEHGSFVTSSLVLNSQKPCVILEIGEDDVQHAMTVPFIWPANSMNMVESETDAFGTLRLQSMVPLQSWKPVSDVLYVRVYARLSNLTLSQNTVEAHGLQSILAPWTAAFRTFSGLPIGRMATVSAIAADIGDGLGSLAREHGWSRPNSTNVTRVVGSVLGFTAVADAMETVSPLGILLQNETTIDPRIAGGQEGDPMDINAIGGVPTMVAITPVLRTYPPGKVLLQIGVNPGLYINDDGGLAISSTAMASAPFRFGKWVMEYIFTVIHSPMHSLKLQISHDPHGSQTSLETHVVESFIFDIKENSSFTLTVGWNREVNLLRVSHSTGNIGSTVLYDPTRHNGIVSVQILNPLASIGEGDSVTMVTYARCVDAWFALHDERPILDLIKGYTTASDNPVEPPGDPGGGDPPVDPPVDPPDPDPGIRDFVSCDAPIPPLGDRVPIEVPPILFSLGGNSRYQASGELVRVEFDANVEFNLPFVRHIDDRPSWAYLMIGGQAFVSGTLSFPGCYSFQFSGSPGDAIAVYVDPLTETRGSIVNKKVVFTPNSASAVQFLPVYSMWVEVSRYRPVVYSAGPTLSLNAVRISSGGADYGTARFEGNPTDFSARYLNDNSLNLSHGPVHDGVLHLFLTGDNRINGEPIVSPWEFSRTIYKIEHPVGSDTETQINSNATSGRIVAAGFWQDTGSVRRLTRRNVFDEQRRPTRSAWKKGLSRIVTSPAFSDHAPDIVNDGHQINAVMGLPEQQFLIQFSPQYESSIGNLTIDRRSLSLLHSGETISSMRLLFKRYRYATTMVALTEIVPMYELVGTNHSITSGYLNLLMSCYAGVNGGVRLKAVSPKMDSVFEVFMFSGPLNVASPGTQLSQGCFMIEAPYYSPYTFVHARGSDPHGSTSHSVAVVREDVSPIKIWKSAGEDFQVLCYLGPPLLLQDVSPPP